MDKRKKIITVLSVIVTVIVILSIVFIIILDNADKGGYSLEEPGQRKFYGIVKNGDETYYRKDDVTSMLIIGVDKGESSDAYNQADFLSVVLLNKSTRKYEIIQINRDSIAEIGRYTDAYGVYLKDISAQITLAYAYGGNTPTVRTEHTVYAVENFLKLHIDKYVCVDMEGIKSLIEYVDGIEIDVTDDLTAVDGSLYNGAHVVFNKANSELALKYLRARQEVGDVDNGNRMNRQKVFFEAFINAVKLKQNAEDFIENGYDTLSNKLISNMVELDYVNYYTKLCDYTYNGTYQPTGIYDLTKDYAEFNVDKTALINYILNKCYYQK